MEQWTKRWIVRGTSLAVAERQQLYSGLAAYIKLLFDGIWSLGPDLFVSLNHANEVNCICICLAFD